MTNSKVLDASLTKITSLLEKIADLMTYAADVYSLSVDPELSSNDAPRNKAVLAINAEYLVLVHFCA